MKNRPSVILIREWEQQMSCSGCCSRLEGDFLIQGGERVFPGRRAAMEAMGPLYQAIRGRFGERVELQVVDPRNFITLLPLLVRDFFAYRVSPWVALKSLLSVPPQGVLLNGRVYSRGGWPPVAELLAALDELTASEPLAPSESPSRSAV